MVKKEDILNMGVIVFNNFAKNKTYPKTVIVKNISYSILEATYLMSTFVANPVEDIPRMKVNGASAPSGDRCNREVAKSTYQDMAKRCSQYIKQNGKLPNWVTIDGKQKCSIILFMLQLSKILKSYKEKKVLPNKILINSNDLVKAQAPAQSSTSSSSLKPYLTNEGCSGMGQCTPYYCACNSLQQAFYRLTGILVSEHTIAEVAGTTTSGTDHDGINTAVAWFNRKYGKNVKITWKNFSDLGSSDNARWSAIQSYINKGAVFFHLLYRDQWGHYEPMKSVGSDTAAILNSLGDYCSYPAYCGYIETRYKTTQKRYLQGISQKSVAILTI